MRPSVLPITRLARWDGSSWVTIEPGSVTEPRVHVMTHGWGPGMRPVVDAHEGFLHVWHPDAETEDGRRFDRWFGPLADAILADDSEAAVLAYSWIDESATNDGVTKSVKSQLRTTVNGQRMAVAVREALGEGEHSLHFIGYSHGAKVATVGASLVEPVPIHLTILDSPDSLVPALGGALNDLGSYLRLLAPELEADESFVATDGDARPRTFVDNYISAFGTQYGSQAGLGSVVDVTLDPEGHVLEEAASGHAYAWAWYLRTAQDPSLGIGYAWSPLRKQRSVPDATQLRQTDATDDVMALEKNTDIAPAGIGAVLRSRVSEEREVPRILSGTRDRAYAFFWRRPGDVWATARVEWLSGPDDATVTVFTNRTERARSVNGWSDKAERIMHVPVAATRSGPSLVTIELMASEPAEVVVGQAVAVNGFVLPAGTELGVWLRLWFWTSSVALVGALGVFALWRLGSRRRR